MSTGLLADKSVVITGAGSGVGRASALLFAAEGASVVCADLQPAWAEETVAMVTAAGGNAVEHACDVTVEQDVAGAIALATERFGTFNVMFNNAGIASPRPGTRLEDHTEAEWDRLMNINLKGVFYGCKQAVLAFKRDARPGVIVNTASIAGMVGMGGTIYGITKGAVIQLTRALAVEAAPDDIRVNCICPASMPTTNFGVNEPTQAFQPKAEDYLDMVAKLYPLGRWIAAEDCAAAALFLASDLAHNVTGVALPVDGGYLAQ